MWTFGKKVAAGFGLAFLLLAAIGTVAYRSIDTLTRTSYRAAHSHNVLEHIAGVLSLMKDAETGQRGFVISGDETFLAPYTEAIGSLDKVVRELRELTADNPGQQQRLDQAAPLIADKLFELKRTIAIRRTEGFQATEKVVAEGVGKRYMDDLRRVLAEMERDERGLLKQRADEVEASAAGARTTIGVGTLLCLVLSTLVGFLLTGALSRQIGSAVRHVQSSSAELQAAANQQVTSAKEQSAAMAEINTTISELLATSRQIAESAQRVARVATETAAAARTGDDTVQRTHESVAGIKRQVDVIVAHMIELGKKSQQIGSVLEIINELAEQTNILAINATIEAAGAGELGRRFAVVADEIRKLADRVGGSTKDIRGLVDDIRAAVNTTVMATEGGSKAVDAGTRQFNEVASSFKQIAGLVATTSEAAKEIELSTKQQSSAVEQVNLAVANVSQAARETEASSGQTLQTSSELTNLSKDLARLIQPQAA
ncbi:MAG TPA: CHASE3 domain-containing protein [Polyangia bacterium]|nr:CHASE3 domain-containing protein [Polyangia bacterium]